MKRNGQPDSGGEPDLITALLEQLVESPIHSFPHKRQRLEVPHSQGVYLIHGPSGEVLHVGKTSRGKRGLFQRLNNHLAGQSSFVALYLRGDPSPLRQGHTFRYLEVEDPRKRALLEALATGQLCPKHIGLSERARGGLKS